MEITNKGLTVKKCVLIVWQKIPYIHKDLFGQSAQLAQKFGILLKKGFIERL